MFESLSSRLTKTFTGLRNRGRINPVDIDETCEEIRVALLEADVAGSVVTLLVEKVRTRSLEQISLDKKGINPGQQIISIVHEELVEILGGSARRLRYAKVAPTVIMLAGLQGSGKTTLAGKLAAYLKSEGNTPVLVACDLQRPNAVDQLQVVGSSVGVPVFAPEPGNGIGDPVKVAKAGIEFAKQKVHNFVIVDTAGRLGVDKELMEQAKNIRDAISPNEVLFVVDAMIGQDAVNTAQAFLDGVGFDGIVLTKMDGDARGGAALSIASVTNRPVMFLSTGEKSNEFEPFHPDRMANRILGMGDVATLAEQAKKALDGDSAQKMEAKFISGEKFTFDDFLEQLQAMKKMGSMSKILGMLPGAQSAQMKKQIAAIDENELTRAEAIIHSMTPNERQEPKIINGSRRARIARGSGTEVFHVNNVLDRFTAAQKAMKQMRNQPGLGGAANVPGMPQGMPGMPGMAGVPAAKVAPPPKKSKSGNPAKRALEGG
jgi:signal recognition particle subunit SRP54